MLRAGQLLPPKGLSTLRFSTGRFPPAPAACYRASWQLPGPDFHRLADTSLRVNHLNVTTSWSSLCTHAAGHTKLGLEGYHDVRSYPDAWHLRGLVIYRFDAPLIFANAKTFRDELRRLARAEPPPTWILIAAEPVTDVDTTASDVLEELDETLNAQQISLIFAELKDPVRRKIERYGLTRTIDPRHFFPTIEAAVTTFREQTGAQWTAVGPATDQAAPGQKAAGTGPPRDIPSSRAQDGG